MRNSGEPKKPVTAKKKMSAVSISDMERVAMGGDRFRLGGDSDIGNTIELGDLNDDLGMSLLMNPTKVNASKPDSGRTFSFTPSPPPAPAPAPSFSGPSTGGSLGGIDITPLEPMEPISIDTQPIDFSAPLGDEFSIKKEQSFYPSSGGGLFSNTQTATGPGVHLSSAVRDPETEKKEKSDFLNKLQRLEQKGFPVARKFTMDNSLEEIKTEYLRLVDARNLEASLKFQRQMLMGAITGFEWLNGRFDPFDLKLDGWSENVHENVEDFDEIFEELYDKYKDKGKMSPEVRLIMAVGGSGFMCHVSNTFFKSKMPSMDEVLRRNPDLARQMATAAAQQAGPGFGNFMGMAMGVQQPQGAPTTGFPMGAGEPVGPRPSAPMQQTGAFFSASGAPPQMRPPTPQMNKPVARREMAGPSGVDDILRQFDEVRRAEMSGDSQQANGFASQPAVAMATGNASVVSAEDLQSQAESTRTGATGGGRRRRRTQAPVGNTFAIQA